MHIVQLNGSGQKMTRNKNKGAIWKEQILKVEHLKKTFNLSYKQRRLEGGQKTKVAVNDISFTAYKGEIFGLLGPNGAGKTTTLRMLATLIRPDSGDAFIDGVSVVKNPYGVRGRIGFLTSELKLEDFLLRAISSISFQRSTAFRRTSATPASAPCFRVSE